MTEIRLYNTATRTKAKLEPLDPTNVRMYVCGPTVYDRAHLGNGRPVVVFDTLFRLLRHVYGADHVTYVRNFTDVDDKINATAQARKAAGDPRPLEALIRERTEETIGWYHADMDALGALRPTHEPRATEFIGPMVAMIADLVARGHAYAVKGHVLFRVRSYKNYGALSGRSVDDMIAGARVEVAPFKEDPMDFVLWKPSDEDLPGWDSPWGRGRPGWHIECSAMADELLMKGLPESEKSFDIHGGGLDLQFPHHENEIAQSTCAHPKGAFARFWMHNEMLQVEGRKMSKSLGNFFTVRDLLDQGVPGEVIRYVYLMTHYRKPMDWTEEKAREARENLNRWRRMFGSALDQPTLGDPAPEVVEALANDLNTAQALSELQKIFSRILTFYSGIGLGRDFDGTDPQALELQFINSARLLGLLEPEMGAWASSSVADLLNFERRFLVLREEAQIRKDYSAADAFKSALVAAGVEVRMSKTGVELVPGPDFDPAKLEALK